MEKLEELTKGATVNGILPDQLVTVIDATWIGTNCFVLTYRDAAGGLGSRLIYRHDEHSLAIAAGGPGASTGTELCSAWSPKPTASAWPTCLTPCWPNLAP